jgi:methyl-accepting chemotaxis protein
MSDMGWSDLSVGKKIGSSIGLILFLVAMLGGIFEFALSTTVNNFSGLIENEAAMIRHGNIAKIALLECRRIEKDLLYSDDVLAANKANEFATKLRSELDIVKTLAKNSSNLKLAEISQKLLKPAEDYQKQFQAMVAAPIGQERLMATLPLRKSAQALEGLFNELLDGVNSQLATETESTYRYASSASKLAIGVSVLVLVICCALIFFVPRSIAQPLSEAVAVASGIASGRLGNSIKPGGNNEVGQLLRAMQTMQGKLSEVVSQIDSLSAGLSAQAESVADTSSQLKAASIKQLEATASAASAIEELTVSITEVSEIATRTETNSVLTVTLSKEGTTLIRSIVGEIEAVSHTVTRSSEQVKTLDQRSQDVGGIANVIKDIADQTNLLALNAAIEAARAGEQGRGFAVVADEVRKLAEKTTKATAEITEKISAIQNETQLVVMAMEQTLPQVQKSIDLTSLAISKLEEIQNQATDSLSMVRDVTIAAKEQTAAATNIAQSIEHIVAMADESNEKMTFNAESAHKLEQMSGELRRTIDYFH